MNAKSFEALEALLAQNGAPVATPSLESVTRNFSDTSRILETACAELEQRIQAYKSKAVACQAAAKSAFEKQEMGAVFQNSVDRAVCVKIVRLLEVQLKQARVLCRLIQQHVAELEQVEVIAQAAQKVEPANGSEGASFSVESSMERFRLGAAKLKEISEQFKAAQIAREETDPDVEEEADPDAELRDLLRRDTASISWINEEDLDEIISAMYAKIRSIADQKLKRSRRSDSSLNSLGW
ncbi:hypothetical protein H6F43_01125 [Leptolyngbya sp. FACHB-36]|uniref:hypothetical protein n=1 Tax=Leptolyngbya sp. FACHB-36 TaxID=2692808 RepID=UPI001681585A|nr:hypothetical protein [Leptolyngbya sp. FACHB-36]MBD2018785.1 hypothetical protein [Leptolyngbya sp. FACHB-36]